jgi:hypothetical protein
MTQTKPSRTAKPLYQRTELDKVKISAKQPPMHPSSPFFCDDVIGLTLVNCLYSLAAYTLNAFSLVIPCTTFITVQQKRRRRLGGMVGNQWPSSNTAYFKN